MVMIMRAFKLSSQNRFSKMVRSLAALLYVWMLLIGWLALVPVANAEQQQKAQRLTEEQRILHVLNRLGFGARPGDVERVKAMGIDKYIDLQLHPEKIDDAVADAKVKNLDALQLSTGELYAKYPQPGQILRQMQRSGNAPPELAAAIDARKNGQAAAPNAGGAPKADTNGEMTKPNGAAKADDPQNNEAYRNAIRDYYIKNGLKPPQVLTAQLQASRIMRAVYSERQLQEVMVDFWTNHFNVFAGKGADRWLLPSYDRDTIRPHTLGKFYDLLLADAQSPAMLFYLDNFQSVSPNAQLPQQRPGARRGPLASLRMSNNPQDQRPQQQQQRRGINENYARELMELHTLGVDGGYTQKDVQEVARCFTGWTIIAPRGAGAAAQAVLNGPAGEMLRTRAGTFVFRPGVHDNGEKIVLGHKIPAGGGVKDGLMVLDILAHHPSTAKFIATKLVRNFVSDEPPPALVDRVAQTYMKTDGDIREMLRTIFSSPEFNSSIAYRAKVKQPFELAVSAVRTLGADTNGGPQFHQWIARMGQPLYGFQTPNGYSDVAENWVNTGALLERMNFALALVSNRIPGTRVNLVQFVGDDKSITKEKLLDRFVTLFVGGEISLKTHEALLKQLGDQITLPSMPPVQTASAKAPENPFEAAFQRGNLPGPGGGDGQQQPQPLRPQQQAAINPATIDNPVIK